MGYQRKPAEDQKMKGFIGYINRYDEDGELPELGVWEVTEDEE